MERRIIVFGHADKERKFGFPETKDFRDWIEKEIFSKHRGRAHYTKGRDVAVIVLSRNGLAHGHFEIDNKVEPDAQDYKDYPKVKVVYIVRSSALYEKPVRLFKDLGIRVGHSAQQISEDVFDKIRSLAGEICEYHQ